jgi:hypothetical protein
VYQIAVGRAVDLGQDGRAERGVWSMVAHTAASEERVRASAPRCRGGQQRARVNAHGLRRIGGKVQTIWSFLSWVPKRARASIGFSPTTRVTLCHTQTRLAQSAASRPASGH